MGPADIISGRCTSSSRRSDERTSTPWAELWAPDGRIIGFYPLEGFPSTIEGREEIVAGFRDGTVDTNDNIAVFRFTDGLISAYHDYFDPRRFQVVVEALGDE